MQASCHCGGVRYEVEEAPEWVLDCNCSRCRLYGALMAYYPQSEVKFATPLATSIYMWGDRDLEFHHCRTCFCFTHYTVAGLLDAPKIGVNARLLRGLDPAHVKVQHKNNGNDGVFWTKSDGPALPGHDLS
ncbi:MAG: hypothetical protein JNJ73_07415 [Hyphomonadaceae bacterium]|nr:hypothetical protein [Hyphomonadaceae bacterium]